MGYREVLTGASTAGKRSTLLSVHRREFAARCPGSSLDTTKWAMYIEPRGKFLRNLLLDGGKHRWSRYRYSSKLWRHQCRVEVIEEEALYEGLSTSYSDLVEDVGEMILDSVLGDVECRGYLLS